MGKYKVVMGKHKSETNALVVDPVKGWGLELLDDKDVAGIKKRLFGRRWLPLVIRQYDKDGKVLGFKEPVLVTDIVSPPGRLYRGLNRYAPLVPMLWGTKSPWMDRLKIGLYFMAFGVMFFVLLVFFDSVTKNGG